MIHRNQPVMIHDYLRSMPIRLGKATVAADKVAMHVNMQVTARACKLGTIQDGDNEMIDDRVYSRSKWPTTSL